MNDLEDKKERMIQLFITEVRVGLIAATMVAILSMITFAQTTRPIIESTPTATNKVVTSDSLKLDKKNTDHDTSVQTNPPVGPAISAADDVEIQRHFNELRSELLDKRAVSIDRWLSVIAVVLTFFGVVVALGGYLGFKQFRDIETEAKNSAMNATKHAEEAERLVAKLEKILDKSAEMSREIREIRAEDVAKEPEKAKQTAANVYENPLASMVDKAIAQAIFLQQQGKSGEAIEKWRAVAHIAEEIDNDLAARAWFSVGYLLRDENSECCVLANDEAIRLKPSYAEAYNNRGAAKVELQRYEEAIADFDEAISLEPDLVEAYNNRGIAKAELGRHEGALADYNEAISLKSDYAEAYTNRGNAKGALGQPEDAIADFDETISLQPDSADAYYNRGVAKSELDLIDAARQDIEKARDLARKAGNDSLADSAEQGLRELDDREDE